MDESAMPLTRIWCIYEVLRTGVPWPEGTRLKEGHAGFLLELMGMEGFVLKYSGRGRRAPRWGLFQRYVGLRHSPGISC